MILDVFKSKMVEYAKAQQAEKLGVLRFFLAQLKNKEIELRPQNQELNDEHVFKVLKKLLKQNAESIEMYDKAGRTEALSKAQAEKAILEEFMQEIPAAIREADAQISLQHKN